MRRTPAVAATIAAGLSLAATPAAPRHLQNGASVSVSPMMVILDTAGRPGSFDVVNFGARTATFRLEPLFAVIDDHGEQQFEQPAGQPGSAAPFLRWAPRQFEVQPGSARSIRLSARPPSDLPPGEYRLHLRATNIGEAPPRPTAAPDRGVGVNVRIQVAQAVRILVRHRVGPGRASLTDVAETATEAGRGVAFALVNRNDGGSVLGRYAVVGVAPGGGERLLREADVTLYPDTARRPVRLIFEPQELAAGWRLCVRFWNSRGGRGAPDQEVCPSPGPVPAERRDAG